MTSQDSTEHLSRRTKIIYGSGDLGFSMTQSIIAILFAIFLTDVVGLRPAAAAAAVFIGKSWDYVNDPLIGYLSDRVRTRWGRRRPFLLFGSLPFAIAFTVLWWRPPIESQLGLAIYFGLAYLLFDTAATLVYMPYFALTPELTLDYDERTSLTSYRMGFSILGSLICFTVPLMIVGKMQPENAGRVLFMGGLFGLLSALPLLLVFLNTRERPEFQAQAQPSFKESLRAAIRNRPFLFAAGLYLFTWMAMNVMELMLLYFIKWRMDMEAQSDLIAGTIFVVALLVLPFWLWVARRWDKRRAYVAGVVLLGGGPDSARRHQSELGAAGRTRPRGPGGIGVSAGHVLPWAIIPDAIELDELTTGKRHEGMFYSLVTLAQKVAASVAIPLSLLVLDATGYRANSTTQPASTVHGIQVLTGPVPAALLCAGILFALLYPLGRERHAQIRAELEKRRGERKE